MFCKKCGTKLNDEYLFCPECGTVAHSDSNVKPDEQTEMAVEKTVHSDNNLVTSSKPIPDRVIGTQISFFTKIPLGLRVLMILVPALLVVVIVYSVTDNHSEYTNSGYVNVNEPVGITSTIASNHDSSLDVPAISSTECRLSVGDTVYLGRYEQDNNFDNGEEPIEWKVLNVDLNNNTILLLSVDALDCYSFDNSGSYIATWEMCSLRNWLNHDFYENSFDGDEKALILDTYVPADINPYYPDAYPGEDTTDKVFLLSISEVEKYLPHNYDRLCSPSNIAYRNGSVGSHVAWWLRSVGIDQGSVATVGVKGLIDAYGMGPDDAMINIYGDFAGIAGTAVRPALCINANSVENITVCSYASSSLVGSYIEFGRYEQDNDLSNGPEPIEWRVLKTEGNMALVISEYGLDSMEYNAVPSEITWEKCTLRNWLNSDFYNIAFNEEEKNRIQTTHVEAHINSSYPDISSGSDTYDNLFLLSVIEAEELFPYDEYRICLPTQYAINKGTYLYSGCCTWWLRTPGKTEGFASAVEPMGNIRIGGLYVSTIEYDYDIEENNYAVRSAMWIVLNE